MRKGFPVQHSGKDSGRLHDSVAARVTSLIFHHSLSPSRSRPSAPCATPGLKLAPRIARGEPKRLPMSNCTTLDSARPVPQPALCRAWLTPRRPLISPGMCKWSVIPDRQLVGILPHVGLKGPDRNLPSDANGQKGLAMQRMRSIIVKLAPVMVFLIVTGVWWPARGDLIRPKASRTYPDIAGDLVGSQTYTYDPRLKTGTFQVTNSPQLIALGPTGNDMTNVSPDQEGTLSQTLQLTLNQNGQIVDEPG